MAQWGLDSDAVAPADYDGDGRTDIAVYRFGAPTVAAFYILQSQTNTVRVDTFGQTGDRPTTVGDYDGDGKADVSVYRRGTLAGEQSIFFYRSSLNNPSGNVTYGPWGITGDVEAPGDYDGDGRFDFCIRRGIGGGAGQFILLRSTDSGVEYINWGLATDAIVPGDYDADGRADFCVTRMSAGAGNFYILERDGGGTGGSPIVFGNVTSDFIGTGDYDGTVGRISRFGVQTPIQHKTSSMFCVRAAEHCRRLNGGNRETNLCPNGMSRRISNVNFVTLN